MGFKIRVKVQGFKELEKQLKELGKAAKKVQRTAATKAIRPMRQAVKAECPKDSGALKKSIDSKVSTKGDKVSAIVGSNTAILEDGTKASEKDEGPRAARHLHLVISGHITEDGTAVPANNFLERGAEASRAECLDIYAEELKRGIEKVVDETGGK
jgi:HK97 gp10 family phage protein